MFDHLRRYGFASGNYFNKCHRCTEVFDGAKRSITCSICAKAMFAADEFIKSHCDGIERDKISQWRTEGVVIVITGGRRWKDEDFVYQRLNLVDSTFPIKAMVNGMAPDGVDKFAYDWAIDRDIPVREFPADWETHGESAGPRRNQEMIDENHDIDLGLVFPGHTGTIDMARRLRKAEIERVFFEQEASLAERMSGWG